MVDNPISSVKKDVVVTMEYRLEVDGKEIDSGPIQFLHGHGNIIPGLEAEVEGMQLNEEKEVFVKAEDAYGFYNPEMEIEMPLTSFPENFEIKLGHPMRLHDGAGNVFTGIAMAMTDETVTLNLNHPLAGKDLLFKTRVVGLRMGTAQEIAQGFLAGACSGCSSGDCSEC
jgi:FKBP-type peptidyl-prolyl cis-trans isomerase SlyD